jgi:hypothetical protein
LVTSTPAKILAVSEIPGSRSLQMKQKETKRH